MERLSQQNRVNKICTDAGFLTTVEVGQYYMTKNTEPERLDSREHQHWARIRIEVTTGYLQGKTEVEIELDL